MLVKYLKGIILFMKFGDKIPPFRVSIDAYKVSTTICMLFLSSISNVPYPIPATYEPSEHTCGNMRRYNREMTVLEYMEIYKS